MNAIHAVLFGIVEGLTEFLPVSSTGHLILTARLLGLPQTEFQKSFEIAIQLGAILAVVLVYGRSLLVRPAVSARVLAAFLPTAVIGLILYKAVKHYLLSNENVVLASLFLGGIALIAFDRLFREKPGSVEAPEKASWLQCIGVGTAQALAVIPGVSRSGATILGGMALGFSRQAVVEFSFLLAVPTILAATALDLLKTGSTFQGADWNLLFIGGAASFVVALASIRFFLRYVQKHGFTAFGIYRILAAAAFWIFVR